MQLKVTISIVLLFCVTVFSQAADFLILGKPSSFSFLNKYEQQLTPADKAALLPFAPLQILKKNQTLGDGITSVMKIKLGQDVYYLMLTEAGELQSIAASDYNRRFDGCEPLADTLVINAEGRVKLFPRYPAEGEVVQCRGGDILVRQFRYRNLYYVKYTGKNGGKAGYGWCELDDHTAWKISAGNSDAVPDSGITQSVRSRVEMRITAVNRNYRSFFDYFNEKTGASKAVPQWQMGMVAGSYRCVLAGGFNYASMLETSTARLIQELRTDLAAEGVEVLPTAGVILIKPRPNPAKPE